MNVTRRSVLQGGLVAAAALPSRAALALDVPSHALLVYDSRLSQSRVLAGRHAGRSVDLAHEHATRWRQLRGLQSPGAVVGLTRWSDLVQVRTLLEERGRRLRAQARCGRLFYWEMA